MIPAVGVQRSYPACRPEKPAQVVKTGRCTAGVRRVGLGQNCGLDEIGRTLGVEEEYHLIDPLTFNPVNRPALSDRVAFGQAGAYLHAEMLTSQLEAVTGARVLG